MIDSLASQWATGLGAAVRDFCAENGQESAALTITLADGTKWDIRWCREAGDFILFVPYPGGVRRGPRESSENVDTLRELYEGVEEILLVRPSSIIKLDVQLNQQGRRFIGFGDGSV